MHPDRTNRHATCSTYRLTFELPKGYRRPSFLIQCYADDSLTAYLNGNSLGSIVGFVGAPRAIRIENPTEFTAGLNTVTLEAGSEFGAFGVDFRIDVEFEPGDPDVASDSDSMPDWWEYQSALDPDLDDADGDLDLDDLTNREEYERGTNPRLPDSDGDGISDGSEVKLGIDPNQADSDGDGFDDNAEITFASDPADPDSVPRRGTVTIASGIDPVTARSCETGDFVPVVLVDNTNWDVIPESKWIHPNPASQRRDCTMYRAVFELPEHHDSPRFEMLAYSDGTSSVSLNEHDLGDFGGFQHPPESIVTDQESHFLTGENTLLIRFRTNGGSDGLDFLFRVGTRSTANSSGAMRTATGDSTLSIQ